MTDSTDTPTAGHAPRPYASLKGVARASAILSTLAEGPMRAKQLAIQLEAKWTTLYRTLVQLEREEFIQKDTQTGAYSIGPRMFVVGSAYLVQHPLVRAAPLLRLVADELGTAAQINERIGHEVVNLIAVDAPVKIQALSVGFRFPLNVTSKGQLLLAFAPAEVQEEFLANPIPRFTDATITDPRELRKRIDEIRGSGYAITRDDLQPRVGSVAAPIRSPGGDVVASLTLIMVSSSMDDRAFLARLIDTAVRTGTRISEAGGWLPYGGGRPTPRQTRSPAAAPAPSTDEGEPLAR